jgi:hypothetical protein
MEQADPVPPYLSKEKKRQMNDVEYIEIYESVYPAIHVQKLELVEYVGDVDPDGHEE